MKNLRKVLSLALALMMIAGCVAAFSSCSKDDTGAKSTSAGETTLAGETTAAKTSSDEKIVIGGVGPLTGTAAKYGISVKQGAELAVSEIKSVNGMDVSLLFEDDECVEENSKKAYGALVDKGMNVSLGAVTSGCNAVVVSECQKDGMLLLTPSASAVTCIDADNAFRICFNDDSQGQAAASFIAAKMPEVTKVAVIYDTSNDYSKGLYESFKGQAEKDKKFELTITTFDSTAKNATYTTQIDQFKSSGAQLVFCPLYYSEAATIITQAKDAGLTNLTYFGCDGFDGILDTVSDKATVEGIMVLTPFLADETSAFVKAYNAKYGSTPDQFAADGYDAVYTIKAALEKSGAKPSDKDFNEKLIAAMTEIEVKGQTGTMTWDATGEPTKEPIVVKITDGKYVVCD